MVKNNHRVTRSLFWAKEKVWMCFQDRLPAVTTSESPISGLHSFFYKRNIHFITWMWTPSSFHLVTASTQGSQCFHWILCIQRGGKKGESVEKAPLLSITSATSDTHPFCLHSIGLHSMWPWWKGGWEMWVPRKNRKWVWWTHNIVPDTWICKHTYRYREIKIVLSLISSW